MKGEVYVNITFYTYPRCTTCRKAKKWLEEAGHTVNEVHLVDETPSAETLKTLLDRSQLDIKKFFNTSGKVYRELGLKDRLADMSEEEKLALLSSNGMLIKRPITTDGEHVTVGFKEAEFENVWKA